MINLKSNNLKGYLSVCSSMLAPAMAVSIDGLVNINKQFESHRAYYEILELLENRLIKGGMGNPSSWNNEHMIDHFKSIVNHINFIDCVDYD